MSEAEAIAQVLVVGGSEPMAGVVQHNLEVQGWRVLRATGSDAPCGTGRHRPALVFVLLEDIDAAAAPDLVRRVQRRHSGVPICLVLATGDPEAVLRLQPMSIQGIITLQSCETALIPVSRLLAAGETLAASAEMASVPQGLGRGDGSEANARAALKPESDALP